MFMERIYFNCLACYEANQKLKNFDREKQGFLVELVLMRDRHDARNEVMKAVDDLFHAKGDIWSEDQFQAFHKNCLECDYSKPTLALAVKEGSDNLRKALKQTPQEKAHSYRENAKEE